MAWSLEFSKSAGKEFDRLPCQVQQRIRVFFKQRVLENPRRLAEALAGSKTGYFRYRIGDYRAIVEFRNQTLVILIIRVGHRKDVYDF